MTTSTNEYPTKAYGATAPDSGVGPMQITRRGLRHDDVLIEITHCGICHSDLHSARNDWGFTTYPIVPGHEIVGTVSAVGDSVTRHANRRPGGDWLHGRCLHGMPPLRG